MRRTFLHEIEMGNQGPMGGIQPGRHPRGFLRGYGGVLLFQKQCLHGDIHRLCCRKCYLISGQATAITVPFYSIPSPRMSYFEGTVPCFYSVLSVRSLLLRTLSKV